MKNLKKLTLLHNNDLHGDFLSEASADKYVGGVSLLSGYVSNVRDNEENVIYAVAGDMFRGSVIDSEYKGISTIEMMNILSPDVVTIGNHEVDYGIAHLLFIEKCAKFPIINANLYLKTNWVRLFSPHLIVERDGMKILFIGIITEDVLAQAKQDNIIGSFIDAADAAKEVGKICNTYNSLDIDLTVLVTHIGIEEDIKLANLLEPEWGVDIIIGGHSHTFIDKPLVENGIVIAHAGTGTDSIGRFDIMIDTDKNCIDSYEWQFVPINSDTAKPDEIMEKCVKAYKEVTDQKYERLVTKLPSLLTHPRRNMETSLGNLFADIFKDSLGVDIMLLGSGSIRSEQLGPVVVYRNLKEIFPYDDGIYLVEFTGDQLRHALKYILREEAYSGHTEFYQVSHGVKITYSRKSLDFAECSLNGKEIIGDAIYRVGMQNFHYANLESFLDVKFEDVKKNSIPRVISTSCLDILEEFLSSHMDVTSCVEGRIEILQNN